jgi:hypothetical protein
VPGSARQGSDSRSDPTWFRCQAASRFAPILACTCHRRSRPGIGGQRHLLARWQTRRRRSCSPARCCPYRLPPWKPGRVRGSLPRRCSANCAGRSAASKRWLRRAVVCCGKAVSARGGMQSWRVSRVQGDRNRRRHRSLNRGVWVRSNSHQTRGQVASIRMTVPQQKIRPVEYHGVGWWG